MLRTIVSAGLMLVIMTILTGIAYPLAMTGLAQAVFPHQANGSLVANQERVVGSKLIGQNFSSPGYFQPRPSAAGKDGYDAASSSGSNLGPTNQKLADAVADNLKKVQETNNLSSVQPVPADLVTASGSGLDPDISLAAAYIQVERVAKARGLAVESVNQLVDRHIQGRQLGLLGEPRVNVLILNLALDSLR